MFYGGEERGLSVLFWSGLVWHGHIALWHDNGKIRLRARSRSEVPQMEGEDGEGKGEGEESSEWRGTPMRPDSGERAIEDFLHG